MRSTCNILLLSTGAREGAVRSRGRQVLMRSTCNILLLSTGAREGQ